MSGSCRLNSSKTSCTPSSCLTTSSVPTRRHDECGSHHRMEVHLAMCINCGCGQINTKHKPTDITMDMLQAAAQGHQMDAEQAADNIHNAAREVRAGKS